MQSINGRFARSTSGGPYLDAYATVEATFDGGVSLNVPAGSVAGSMDRDTARQLGSALIACAGGTATMAPPTPVAAVLDPVSYTDWSIEIDGEEAKLFNPEGELVHTFFAPRPTQFVG